MSNEMQNRINALEAERDQLATQLEQVRSEFQQDRVRHTLYTGLVQQIEQGAAEDAATVLMGRVEFSHDPGPIDG